MSDGFDDSSWDVQFPDYNASSQSTPRESHVPNKIRFGRGNDRDNRRSGNQSSDSSEIVFVNQKYVSRIIGRRGSKIQYLQNASGAQINISKEYDGEEVPISLVGDAQEIQIAREMIEEIKQSTLISSQQENGHKDSSNWIEKTITIPDSKCGSLIGRGGSRIKALREKSGAQINVQNTSTPQGWCYSSVVIKGDENCVKEAESLIYESIGESDSSRQSVTSDVTPSAPRSFIDWENVNVQCQEQTRKRWGDLEPIRKNFYIEDNVVADMLPNEVDEWRKENFNISVTHLVEENPCEVLNPVLTFEQAFNHYPEILETIYNQNFKKPSPIQSQAWPLAMRGYDVIGVAQTGTGKTLGFLLPVFIHIDGQSIPRSERKGPSCLILTPTRELALQIETEIKKYHYRDIRCVCVYGGGDRRKQIDLVTAGVEIVVATPGRFNDLLANNFVSLDSVTFLVLDEADRMLDMGFEPQIMKILLDIRPDRQTMMTSATWPEGVRRLARSYLTEPMQVAVGSLDLAAVHTVKQIVEVVAQEEKKDRLLDFIACMKEDEKVLIFVGRRTTADDLSADLCLKNISCQSIHGGREQYDREQALDDFKTGYVRILVATDVASRGLDVADITHVFNYDFPRNSEEYVHRVGRTGRAGKSGTSVTLVTREDWGTANQLIEILTEAQQNVPIELQDMADRFAQMKVRREAERGSGGYRGSRRGGFRRRNDRW